MIRRIELVNFMSHAKTVIEPAEGLTVLVGPNNCGKSAVVAALQILCRNDNSTYVLRHNERACSVTVETDDGHTIVWSRTKTSPRYEIDGVPFDRLDRGGVPDALHSALRLPLVTADDNVEFDVHFGDQKSPIFLLDKPPSSAAQFFASSSDASALIEMQKLHQQRTAETKRSHKELDSCITQLEQELQILKPIASLDEQLTLIESDHRALNELASKTAGLKSEINQIRGAEDRLRSDHARAGAMSALLPLPVMGDIVALANCIQLTEQMRIKVVHAHAVGMALASIESSPTFESEAELRVAVVTLAQRRLELVRLQRIHECVGAVQAIDPVRETKQIEQAIAALDSALRTLRDSIRVVEETRGLFAVLDREIAAIVQEQPNCPTCGAELDPTKLQLHFHGTQAKDSDA